MSARLLTSVYCKTHNARNKFGASVVPKLRVTEAEAMRQEYVEREEVNTLAELHAMIWRTYHAMDSLPQPIYGAARIRWIAGVAGCTVREVNRALGKA
jgi:hypothetical protein